MWCHCTPAQQNTTCTSLLVCDANSRTFPVEELFLEDVVEQIGYNLESDSEFAKYDEYEDDYAEATNTSSVSSSSKVELLIDDSYSSNTHSVIERLRHDRINYELIEQLLVHVDEQNANTSDQGAILVFLPGLAEISHLFTRLMSNPIFYEGNRFRIMPLHSSISQSEQNRVFESTPAHCRKIVLSTNIAETGVTIPDITCVIDSGKVKEMRAREANRLMCLKEVSVSAASARQRAGRAGRVQAGVCFRLFTRRQYSKLARYTTPEICRVPLEALALHILASQSDTPQEILAEALDPPTPRAVENAMRTLREVGAIKEEAEKSAPAKLSLSTLGQYLSLLPLDVRLAKMLVYGALLSCLEPILTIVAAISYKSPFVVPIGKRQEADAARFGFKAVGSDLITIVKCYSAWETACIRGKSVASNFCRRNFLSESTFNSLKAMREDLRRSIASVGLCPKTQQGTYHAALHRALY